MPLILEEKKITLGDKIALLMEKENLNQQNLADKLDVNRSTISLWLNNKKKPSRTKRIQLAKLFNKPFDYFDEDNLKSNSKSDNVNLKIIIGFRNNSFTYESDDDGFVYQPVPILELNGEVAGLSMQEIESQFFVWIEKKDKYVVRKCNEIGDGRFFLIYDDYELKIVDMKTDANKKQSSSFRVVGKLLKLIRDLE